MSSNSSDLYEEALKPNESHTNRIIQIVPCKTAFTEALRLMYKKSNSFVYKFVVNLQVF